MTNLVKAESTRTVVRRLREAGFTEVQSKGSHSKWTHPKGVMVIVPTGHRTISPGVVRQINVAIQRSQEK